MNSLENAWGEAWSPWIRGELSIWEPLISDMRQVNLPKGDALFQQGDEATNVYCVSRGRLRVSSVHHTGSEKQLYIAEQSALVAETECLSGFPFEVTATAIVNSSVYVIPKAVFLSRIAADHDLARSVLDYEARKSACLQHQILLLAHDSARARIAQVLLNLCHLYGRKAAGGTLIDVRFTKNDIAGMVGTSRVTASNVLMDMKRQGILGQQRSRYVVLDTERLESIVEGD